MQKKKHNLNAFSVSTSEQLLITQCTCKSFLFILTEEARKAPAKANRVRKLQLEQEAPCRPHPKTEALCTKFLHERIKRVSH